MRSITNNRKEKFCRDILSMASSKIGFADIGSGGALKLPWSLLPSDRINKFNFDAEEVREYGKLPLCISNDSGEKPFYIARDPRSSSLHLAAKEFVERYADESLLVKEVEQVLCSPLDRIFAEQFRDVDLLDINVEGHDFQVLEGAANLLQEGFVKCIKIEFELTQVWQGQGWFSDIDRFLRDRKFDMAFIDIEYSRPANVRSLYHLGEPLWGKAIYVPGSAYWSVIQEKTEAPLFREDVLKAVALYTILDIPGRAVDLLRSLPSNIFSNEQVEDIISRIFSVYSYAKLDKVASRFTDKLSSFLK